SFGTEQAAIGGVQTLRFDGTRAPYFASEESPAKPIPGPVERRAAVEGSNEPARKLQKTENGDVSAGQANALELPAAVHLLATYPRCVGKVVPDMDRDTAVDVCDVRDMVLGLTCEAQLPSWSRVELLPGAVAVGRALQSEPDFSLSAMSQMLSVPRAPEAAELAVPSLAPAAPVPAGWEGPLPPGAYALTLEELMDNDYPLLEDTAAGELAVPPGYVLTRPWKELEEEALAEEAGSSRGAAESAGAGEPAELAGAR
ncbi:hypothetical protein H632_c3666p0, partial [Helicosporidium sp. ATCC 50920]